jgi:hypothetical protein|nr:MAG TPA: hypothetical protein [Caudoviricetes sp.]
MTLDELNSVIMQQNRNVAIDKHRTCYECYNIHTNRLVASAATIDELKDIMVRMDIIRG